MDAPILNNLFTVTIDGIGEIGFLEIDGIEQCINVVEYREGNYQREQILKIPGLIRNGSITLKKGVGTDVFREILEWFESVKICNNYKRLVTIEIKNCEGGIVCFLELKNAWPFKYRIGKLNALENEVLIETLELTFESLDI